MVAGTRFFRFAPTIEATLWLLDCAIESSKNPRVAHMDFQIVCDGVLVHVDHTARHDLHTGIQQVVRQVYRFGPAITTSFRWSGPIPPRPCEL